MKSGLFSTSATLFGGFDAFTALHPTIPAPEHPLFNCKKIAFNTRESDFFAS